MSTQPETPSISPAVDPPPQTGSQLLDSTLLVALVAAMCYAVGYLVQRNDAAQLGIPRHLLPETQLQSTILIGAVNIVLLIAVGVIVYLLIVLFGKLLPATVTERLHARARVAFGRHPLIYSIVLLLIVTVVLVNLGWHSPVRYESFYNDRTLPNVVELRGKGSAEAIREKLKYISRRDGWVVLKIVDKKQYVLLNQDELERLVLEPSE